MLFLFQSVQQIQSPSPPSPGTIATNQLEKEMATIRWNRPYATKTTANATKTTVAGVSAVHK